MSLLPLLLALLQALQLPDLAVWRQAAPPVFQARFETSKGAFVIEVEREWAPNGADRFYNLVRLGYYDEARFHRVVPGFIAQWGLHADPRITSIWKNRTIPDEPVKSSNVRGTVAFAFAVPHGRATQVFISLADNSRLDRDGFPPIGRVISGMDVVDRLYSGYGENSGGGIRAGKQGPIENGGNAYLKANYPELDFIIRARLLE